MLRWIPLWAAIWLAGITCQFNEAAAQQQRPNIVVILSDDMGFSDLGCYGGEIQTPTLDRLAAGGLRFTQFYNTARCCPTRASLLTGLYPHQAGVGWMMEDQRFDGYRGELNRRCLTIAEVLGTAGYGTYHVGKWHVTQQVNPASEDDKHNWPCQRGFERCYGLINGASSLWDPNSLVRDNQLITCRNDAEYQPIEPYHITDAFSDNAATYVREHDFARPMFMYLAYTAAHWPLHARQRDIEKYAGVYDQGYDAIRATRIQKMKDLGFLDAESTIAPTVGDWMTVPDERWEALCMQVYAAMIDQMDQGIGRLVAALEEAGQLDNTLILFLQDNGGCAESAGRDADPTKVEPRPEKPTLPLIADDLVHYFGSVPPQTRDGFPIRRGHVDPGPADTYIGYGRNWANVSNTPFREYKHWVHEGGIATPLIVHWPADIEAPGELRHQPGHLIDIMATCIDVAGADYPDEFNGQSLHPLEGISLLPAFVDMQLDRDELFWEHEGNRAIRIGDWKLVAKGKMKDRSQPVKWELYDLSVDRAESNDLSEQFPERVQQMSDRWNEIAWRTCVFPAPAPPKELHADADD